MLKVLFWTFIECLSLFTMLHVKGSSKTGVFRNLSNHLFRSPYFRKYISYEDQLFLKMLKIHCKFHKRIEKWEKICCSWERRIWSGCFKFSLLRREYLSLGVNVLRNSLKILHVTKRDFFQLNYLQSDQ